MPPVDPAAGAAEESLWIVVGLFLPVASFLRHRDIQPLGAACRSSARALEDELSRRDALSKTLHLWGANDFWDAFFAASTRLDWARGCWRALPPMAEARTRPLCALVGTYLYVCGGSFRGRPTSAVERLDLEAMAWEALPPMPSPRRVDADGSAAVVLGGQLYICGGLSLDGCTGSCCADRLDTERLCWETLPPMPQPRYRTAAVLAGDFLYMCGGSEGGRGACPVSSVVRFDREANAWESLPSMIEKRSGSDAVFANKNIYVGSCAHIGTQGVMQLSASGERFNTETRRWSRCPPGLLCTPGALAAAVASGCLFVCEGTAHGPSPRGCCSDAKRVAGTEHVAATMRSGALVSANALARPARRLQRGQTA